MLNKNKKPIPTDGDWCFFAWVPFKETKDKSAVGMLQSCCLEQNVLMEEWVFRGQRCTPTTCLAIYCMLVKQFKTHSCHCTIQHKFSVTLAHKEILLTFLTSIPYRTSETGFPDKKHTPNIQINSSNSQILWFGFNTKDPFICDIYWWYRLLSY